LAVLFIAARRQGRKCKYVAHSTLALIGNPLAASTELVFEDCLKANTNWKEYALLAMSFRPIPERYMSDQITTLDQLYGDIVSG